MDLWSNGKDMELMKHEQRRLESHTEQFEPTISKEMLAIILEFSILISVSAVV